MTKKKQRDYFHPYPKYLQISELLRARVQTQLRPGDRLPAETALSAEFGVSRETIRQALEPLQHDRLISRTPGRGSVVIAQPQAPQVEKLTGMSEDFVTLGMKTEARLLGQEVLKARDEEARYLGVALDSPIVRIERLRFFEGEPLSVHVAVLPLDPGSRVLRERLELTSIVTVLTDKLHYRLVEDRQVVEAEPADVALASHLAIPIGSPVLLVRRLYVAEEGRPIAYFRSYFRADRYKYTVKLTQPEPRRSRTTRHARGQASERKDK